MEGQRRCMWPQSLRLQTPVLEEHLCRTWAGPGAELGGVQDEGIRIWAEVAKSLAKKEGKMNEKDYFSTELRHSSSLFWGPAVGSLTNPTRRGSQGPAEGACWWQDWTGMLTTGPLFPCHGAGTEPLCVDSQRLGHLPPVPHDTAAL